jgi:hypothetical protein
MTKKKKSKKLSECEERAIVTLEAKRIREKEQKQKTREKRKRENEDTGGNKMIALGGQVLPYQTGIQPLVPKQTYRSYSQSVPLSFEERFLRPAAAQAPAALQAYLFMNSGQHRERIEVQRRNQAVQAGGNQVGGNENINLMGDNVPGAWFFDPNRNVDRSKYDTTFAQTQRQKQKAEQEAAKQAKTAARQAGQEAASIARRRELAAKAGIALAQGKKLTVRQFSDIYRGAGALASSLSQSVLGGLNRLGDFLAGPSSKKTDAETQSLLGNNDEESAAIQNKKDNRESELRNRKGGGGAFSSQTDLFRSLRGQNVDESKENIEMDDFMSSEEIADMKKNQAQAQLEEEQRKAELLKQQQAQEAALKEAEEAAKKAAKRDVAKIALNTAINDRKQGKQMFKQYLTNETERRTAGGESLLRMSTKWGLNGDGLVVDRLVGKFLHPAYKDENIFEAPPEGYLHYDEVAYNKIKRRIPLSTADELGLPSTPSRNLLDRYPTQIELQSFGSPSNINTEQDFNPYTPDNYKITTRMNTSTSIIPNTGLNESNNDSFMQRYGDADVSYESGAFYRGGSSPAPQNSALKNSEAIELEPIID